MLKLDESTIVILMLLGMDYYMLFSGFWQACAVFKKKTNRVFLLVISGLLSTIVEVSASYMWLYVKSDSNLAWGVITLIFWHLMLQIPCWLYCVRIQTLNGFDLRLLRIVNKAPYVLGLFQIPSFITFALALSNHSLWGNFVIASAITTVGVSIIEVLLYLVLIRRVKFMFEHKSALKRQMLTELTLSTTFLIVIDIALLCLKLGTVKIGPLTLPATQVQFDNALRPFSYMLRIKIAIQFFNELIDNANDSRTSTAYSKSFVRWTPVQSVQEV